MHTVGHVTLFRLLETHLQASLTSLSRYGRSQCTILAKGFFKQDSPSIRLYFNITSEDAGEMKPVFVVEDDFCDWVDVRQGGAKSCPPKRGTAVIRFETLLVQGWIPEVREVSCLSHLYMPTNSFAGEVRHRYRRHLEGRVGVSYLYGFAT